MTELSINSYPSGAQVTIDDEMVGTTPMFITIGEEDTELEKFRDDYMSGGLVSAEWTTFKSVLEDHTVANLWWRLTRNERYSIAKTSVENTLFNRMYHSRRGESNCVGGVGEWKVMECVGNAIIRVLQFGKRLTRVPYWSPTSDECYYKRYETSEEHCYVPDIPYGLPCFYVSKIADEVKPGTVEHHALAAIQIENNYDSLDSWIIFQYSDFDIKSGDHQIPFDSTVKFSAPYGTQCGVVYGDRVASFHV